MSKQKKQKKPRSQQESFFQVQERPAAGWRKLDNAAKIFPSNSTARDPKVFRFSCELKEPVQEAILQRAAERTLSEFPFFRYTLRHGMFWYYLQDGQFVPTVQEENTAPCQPLYVDAASQLFRIRYWQNHLHFEVYHVLTDGTGAMAFLRTLVCHYLREAHPEALQNAELDLGVDASAFQKMGDSFDKYYTGQKGTHKSDPPAYRIKAEHLPIGQMRVTIGELSASALLRQAHARGTTLTVLLTACFLCAVCEEMPVRKRKKPVVATIPVNLRNFFASETARNFFSIVNIGVDFSKTECTLDAVIPVLTAQLKERLTKEAMQERLNRLTALEHNPFARVVPLALKNVILQAAGQLADLSATVSVSNIGKIKMPEALSPYIRKFDIYISTSDLQICSCTYGDILSIGMTSAFVNTDIERRFFRKLTEMEIPVTISTNLPPAMEEVPAP